MQAMWSVVAFLIGNVVCFLLIRPQLKRSESERSSERSRADESEKARQNLEIEAARISQTAERVPELATELANTRTLILELTQKHSSVSASLAAQEEETRDLKAQLAGVSQELNEVEAKLKAAELASAELQSRMSQREIAVKEERAQLAEIKSAFKSQFAELSVEALRNNSQTFLENAKRVLEIQHQAAEGDLQRKQDEIKQLVEPITSGINAVNEATRQLELARATAFGNIEQQLQQSVKSAAEVAKQAGALKDALKRPNVRGRWGELQLRNCVELAGMEEHCDVEFQETSLTPENEAIRPDMIVRMPGGRKIAVDSKTPMIHFLSYIDANTDDERQSAMLSHGRAVNNHIDALSKADYMQKLADSPDFVVMFLPNESFLAMALEKAPTLMEDALAKKVLVATPGTLIGLLKVVLFGWNEQKIAHNAQRIADEGSKLNGEIVKLLGDFARLGNAIESVNEAFGNSRQRVVSQIAKTSLTLTDLGAKNRSSILKGKRVRGTVASMLKEAGADDEEIEVTENPDGLALAASGDEDENEE